MPNYIRPRVTGATVFFTVCLSDRYSSALIDHVGDLRDSVRETRSERPFHIDAWVVLPDHLHCMWTLPTGDADFSTRWGAIKARFTRRVKAANDGGLKTHPTAVGRVGFHPTVPRSFSKVKKKEAGLWQRRFWEHHIRNSADYKAHLEYCWFNPVKHGLVDDPQDWPFSSWHRDNA